MNLQAKLALFRIEDRILELPEASQERAETLAHVIQEFAKNNGAIGHVALNLATARMAVEVLE